MIITGVSHICRGSTILWQVSFTDSVSGAIRTPNAVSVNIVYPAIDGSEGNALIDLVPPVIPATIWTGSWETQNVGPGTVSWSVHSKGGGAGYGVKDGEFVLTANPANVPSPLWLLSSGLWNDSGVWLDSAAWID
jgi:hypothetical protein